MNHDPLCPANGLCECGCEYDTHCLCDLIAKVRADEQELMTEDCDCSDCVPPPLPPSVGVPEKRWFK